MSSNKVQGMCAPTYCPTLVERMVKGYIFLSVAGHYYLSPGNGMTADKSLAYIHSREEIAKSIKVRGIQWAGKAHGKWLIVYE